MEIKDSEPTQRGKKAPVPRLGWCEEPTEPEPFPTLLCISRQTPVAQPGEIPALPQLLGDIRAFPCTPGTAAPFSEAFLHVERDFCSLPVFPGCSGNGKNCPPPSPRIKKSWSAKSQQKTPSEMWGSPRIPAGAPRGVGLLRGLSRTLGDVINHHLINLSFTLPYLPRGRRESCEVGFLLLGEQHNNGVGEGELKMPHLGFFPTFRTFPDAPRVFAHLPADFSTHLLAPHEFQGLGTGWGVWQGEKSPSHWKETHLTPSLQSHFPAAGFLLQEQPPPPASRGFSGRDTIRNKCIATCSLLGKELLESALQAALTTCCSQTPRFFRATSLVSSLWKLISLFYA